MIGDKDPSVDGSARRRVARVRTTTRKLHNYLGLYLLLFLWLFSVSGLVLNHSEWVAAQFWNEREETTTQRAIRRPNTTGDVAVATDLMRQLGVTGEIGEIERADDGGQFDIQVVRPGRVVRVEARLDSARATVTTIELNAWGVLDALHKFTGASMDDPARTRDWAWTKLWSFAMDALSVGLLVLVVSGLFLWYRLPEKRRPGLVALVLGLTSCAFFLFGFGTWLA